MEIEQLQGQQVQGQNEVKADTQQQVHEEPKMVSMTQEQLDKLIADRLSRQERKLEEQFNKRLDEMSEAQKLQAMDEKEKAEYQAKKEREQFEQERQAFYAERDALNKQKYQVEIQRQLHEAGLPDVSGMLVNLGAEEVKAQIDIMKESFTAQINSAVESRVKSSATTPLAHQGQVDRLFTLEEIQAMSREEVRKNKAQIDKSLDAIARQQGLLR